MRKILFSFIGGVLILAGCSKDSDNNASIVGTWNANKIVSLEYVNNTPAGGDTTTLGTLVFNSDGTVTSTDSSGTDNGTYTYNSSSKLLTIVSDGDTTKANVTNLTSSDLHFNASETQEYAGSSYKVTVDADYKR